MQMCLDLYKSYKIQLICPTAEQKEHMARSRVQLVELSKHCDLTWDQA